MYTQIDAEIINHFFSTKPNDDGSSETDQKIEDWFSFRRFIRSNSNLTINDIDSLLPAVKKQITDGVGENNMVFNTRKINIHNGRIPKGFHPSTFFCFEETEKSKKSDLIKRNNYLIGFKEDYIKKWHDLSLKGKKTILPVSKDNVNSAQSWHELLSSVLPFKTAIISDHYILEDVDLIEKNLIAIWSVFDKVNPETYDLVILTSDSRKLDKDYVKLDAGIEHNRIMQFAKTNCFKGRLSLFLNNKSNKEHDRNIFMSYHRIFSGDSFNYFNSAFEIITHGTELQYHSYSNHEAEAVSLIILNRIKDKINKILSKGDTSKYHYDSNLNIEFLTK